MKEFFKITKRKIIIFIILAVLLVLNILFVILTTRAGGPPSLLHQILEFILNILGPFVEGTYLSGLILWKTLHLGDLATIIGFIIEIPYLYLLSCLIDKLFK